MSKCPHCKTLGEHLEPCYESILAQLAEAQRRVSDLTMSRSTVSAHHRARIHQLESAIRDFRDNYGTDGEDPFRDALFVALDDEKGETG